MNWEAEHQRFMTVAYGRGLAAAKRAFGHWEPRKREDASAEFMAKLWDQWKRLLDRGKDPEPLLYPLLHWAKQWVYQDRRLSGRARNIDIQDYRAGQVQHLMNGQGRLEAHDRSGRINGFLDWTSAARTDDPGDLAGALAEAGVGIDAWYDLDG